MTQKTGNGRRDIGDSTPIRDVMTRDVSVVDENLPLVDAARTMRERDIGDVLVQREGGALGIVTDRDLVVRGLANGVDPGVTTVGEVCTGDVVTLSPDDTVGDAVSKMRDRDVRRLPVVEDGRAVGIVSLGDLAIERDPTSALADISSAPPST